jgi:NAD(P)-dependent dehydrogenase (short-subunit alcohol dehydrogenase family)
MDQGGVIIYISSLVGKPGITYKGDSIAYPASKAALNKLMEGVVAVYGPKIRSACISPGYVKTKMWNRFDAATVAASLANVPNKQFVEPGRVASLVKEIISNEAITGVNFEIDNGLGLKLIF